MRTTSELPRILAVSLLWCGVLVIALYALCRGSDCCRSIQRFGSFRSFPWCHLPFGLLVVPIALALVVAGGGLLMSQRRKRRP